MAARYYELTGRGYVGLEPVLDKAPSQLILELNALPGLNIQITNCTGLLMKLNAVEREAQHITAVGERVAFARGCFGVMSGAEVKA